MAAMRAAVLFLIVNDFFLSSFDLQVAPILLIKFRVNGLSVQEKKFKIEFQDGGRGGNLGFPIGIILAILVESDTRAKFL